MLLWVCWCALACLVVALVVQLPSIIRWILVLAISVAGLRGFRYLCPGGGNSVQAVRWTRDGGLFLRAEPVGRWVPARLGSWFRFGAVWLLEFRTAEGGLRLAVDVRCQHPQALRRLARSLEWGPGRPN